MLPGADGGPAGFGFTSYHRRITARRGGWGQSPGVDGPTRKERRGHLLPVSASGQIQASHDPLALWASHLDLEHQAVFAVVLTDHLPVGEHCDTHSAAAAVNQLRDSQVSPYGMGKGHVEVVAHIIGYLCGDVFTRQSRPSHPGSPMCIDIRDPTRRQYPLPMSRRLGKAPIGGISSACCIDVPACLSMVGSPNCRRHRKTEV